VRFIPHTEEEISRMLETVGAPSVSDLFACIPQKLHLERPLDLPAAASEQTTLAELTRLAQRNTHAGDHAWFLGAGTYPHFSPSVLDAIASRAEFLTAYTPYQPEMSQGTLQVIFEWQTMMCGLTGMEVSNASLYDGASATAEAALMAMRLTRRSKVAVAAGLHPHYRDVLGTYLSGLGGAIVDGARDADGRSDSLTERIDDDTACLIVQQPGFLGPLEDLSAAAEAAHARGALLVVAVTEALSLALLRAPGELGADLVCGEAQSFGLPMGFGGPHLGFLASRQKHVRQMPGRLAGQTVDSEGRRGFVLTLSTREQHIRRERATSNICTNQGLCLLLATVYLALHGRGGLRALAEVNLAKAEYARARVRETPGLTLPFQAPGFNEFVVGLAGPADAALSRALDAGIVGGLDLAPYAPELGPALLVCTTERAGREDIDRLVSALAGAAR
jgi:glycine dehydrogenase subunit 1